MHDYAYFGKTHGANPPELQVRIATFQSEIVVAMDSNVDEVFFLTFFRCAFGRVHPV